MRNEGKGRNYYSKIYKKRRERERETKRNTLNICSRCRNIPRVHYIILYYI